MRFTIGIATLATFSLLSGCAGRAVINANTPKKAPYRTAVIMPFASSVQKVYGLPDATRTAVTYYLKEDGPFPNVRTPDEAVDKSKADILEISATLVDFDPGNMATRMIVGLGTGRAHAAFDFIARDGLTGEVVWRAKITEKASFWSSGISSSSSERLELPEKIAKTLAKELKKAYPG